jgi:hypothetical protein
MMFIFIPWIKIWFNYKNQLVGCGHVVYEQELLYMWYWHKAVTNIKHTSPVDMTPWNSDS